MLSVLGQLASVSAQVTNTNTVTNGGAIGSGTTSIITNPVTSITGAITNNGSLIFAQTNSTVTDPFVISGSGSLTVSGLNGITILTAANTYTGSTVINAGSTLQIGTNGTTGSLASTNLVVNGALIYNLSSAPTVANIFTGSGSVTFGGNGNYTLTGTNRAAVTVIDTNARLSISSGTVFGSGQVVNNGGITVTAGTTLSNSISGTGSLTQSASGSSLTITGSNSYSGGTYLTGNLNLSNTSGPAITAGSIYFTSYPGQNVAYYLSFFASNQLGSNVNLITSFTSGGGNGTQVIQLQGTAQTIGNLGGFYTGNTAIVNQWTGVNYGTSSLTIYQTTNDTFAGAIINGQAGSAAAVSINKMGTATLTLMGRWSGGGSGHNSYTGTTFIGQGALAAGQGSAFSSRSAVTLSNDSSASLNLNGFANTIASLAGGGSLGGNVLLGSNGVLTMGTNTTTTYFGVISGTNGGITQQGTGTLILLGNNSYTGTTTINSGATIQAGTNSTNGSIGTGSVVANGQLLLNMGVNQFFNGAVSGTGTITQAGSGTLFILTNSTFSGAWNIRTNSTLQVGTNGIFGNLGSPTAINNNGNLIFNLATNLTNTGIISGAGSISQIGSGTLFITTANTNFTGNWAIGTNSTLQVGNNSTNGSLGSGSVTNSGNLIFNLTSILTLSNAVTGAGSLTQAGTGTLILGGSNSYTGTTFISAGTLQIGTNGTNGSLPLGTISNNATLALNVSGLLNLSNQMSGSGTVAQIGSGTTVLAQSNSFSGAYLLSTGGFDINNPNALGTGTLILNGGTLGNSSGSSVTNVRVTPVLINSNFFFAGASDLNLGTGSVTLAGSRTITILQNTLTLGGNVSGAFSITKQGPATLALRGSNSYSGGTIVNAGTMILGGTNSFASGNVTLNSNASVLIEGTVTTTGNLLVGTNSNDRSLVILQTNGSLNMAQANIGNNRQGLATVLTNISGALYINGGNFRATNYSSLGLGARVGNLDAYGYVLQTGGTSSIAGLSIGGGIESTISAFVNGAGVYDLLGGTLNITANYFSPSFPAIMVGAYDRSPAVLNINGGLLISTNASQGVVLGFFPNQNTTLLNIGNGTLNLGTNYVTLNNTNSFFTLASNGLYSGLGIQGRSGGTVGGILNLNGGILRATTNSTSFLTGLSNVLIGPGGVVLDNGGFAITIAQNLSGSNGTGLSAISITNGGAGYIGAPIVQISGGGGIGATAIAQIDTNTASATYGQLTNLVVTAPGTGYTSAPTISLLGGGFTTAASGFGSTLAGFTSGSFTYAGAGTTTLTGTNTYTGGTLIQTNSSVLVTTSPSPFGTGSITNNGQLIYSNSATITVGGIAGTGALTQAGSGTLIFGANNTFTGTTLINAGTLQIGTNGVSGNIPFGPITNNATLRLNVAGTLLVTNRIGGTGTLSQVGSGTAILVASNSYGAITIGTNSALQLGTNNADAFLPSVAITNSGNLIFDIGRNVTLTNVLSGSGSVTQTGSGTLIMAASMTYTGSTVIDAGSTLQIGTNGTTGSLASTNLIVNGNLIYSLSGAQSINDVMTGSGSVTFRGSGTYTYTGTNRSDGGTLIDTNATLSISAGTVFGSGQVVNNGGIAVTAVTTLSNTISGTGSLTISGNPALITGSNSYSGVTWVTGGLTLSNTTGPALYANGGSGTIVLSSSSYALSFGAANQLGSNVSVVYNATGPYAIVQLRGNSQTIGSIIQSNGATHSMLFNYETPPSSNTGPATLTFNQTTNTTFSGFIRDSGSGINTNYSLALTKMGAATFTITSPQAVAYSGATTIGQGVFAAGSANALSASSAFILSNNTGVSLNLNGFANTIASLAGGGSLGGNVLLGSNGVLTMGTNTTTTYSGVISGTGTAGITQQGTGTLILLGNNSYTGTTTINSGATIQVGTNSTNGSLGTGSVIANGRLLLNMGVNQFFNGAVSGSGTITQAGSGTLFVVTNSTFSGAWNIQTNSTLQVGTNSTAGSLGTASVVANGNLVFNLATNMTLSGNISGSGSISQIGSGTLAITGAGTNFTGNWFIGTNGSINVGNGGSTGSLGGGRVVNNGNLILANTAANIVSNTISGSGSLTVNYTLTSQAVFTTITGSNTYSGPTYLYGGNLMLSNSSGPALYANGGSGTIVMNSQLSGSGFNLLLFGRNNQLGSNVAISYIAGSVNHSLIDLMGYNQTIGNLSIAPNASTFLIIENQNVSASGTVSGTGTLTIVQTNNLLYNQFMVDTSNNGGGKLALVKDGSATITFVGNNTTFSGGLVITNGGIQVGNGLTNGAPGTGSITVGQNGALYINQTSGTTFTNNVSNNGLVSGLQTNGSFNILSGVISGTGSFVQIGAGTSILTGSNTYSGGTVINSNTTIQVGNAGTTGSLGSGPVVNSGLLAFNLTSLTTNTANISGTGSLTQRGSGTLILAGSNSYTGTTLISAGTLQIGTNGTTGTLGTGSISNNANLQFALSSSYTLTNRISGSGSLTQAGTGTILLAGSNSYAGGVFLRAGTLAVGANNALGTGTLTFLSNNTVLQVVTNVSTTNNMVLSTNGIFSINDGLTMTNGGIISGAGGLIMTNGGTMILTAANTYTGFTFIGNGVLQIGTNGTNGSLGANTGPVTNNGALVFNLATNRTFSNVITGTGSVGQIGSGTTTLAASNSYTGTTYLRGGMLTLATNGSINSSTNINLGLTNAQGTFNVSAFTNGYTIRTNQSLTGVGTITTGATNRTVTVAGSIAPGNSIGTIAVIGNLVLTNGSFSTFDLGNPGATNSPASGLGDRITVTGDLTLGGSLILVNNSDENGQGSMGPGAYRLFTYSNSVSGAFTNNLDTVVVNGGLFRPTVVTNTADKAIDLNILQLASGSFFTNNLTVAYHVTNSGTVMTNLGVSNMASSSGYLGVTLTNNSGSASITPVSFSNLAPAGTTNFVFTFSATNAGSNGGVATFAMFDTGTNGSGPNTSLATNLINYSAIGYTLASGTVTTNINLGVIHVGDTFSTGTLTVSNAAAATAYTENLGAAFTNASGVTATGSFTNLTPGSSDGTILTVGLGNALTAGTNSGTVQVVLTSYALTDALGNTVISTNTVTVTGIAYAYASAGLSTNLNVGRVHVGGTFGTGTLSVTNTGAPGAFTEWLAGQLTNASGVTASGSLTNLSGGSSSNAFSLSLGSVATAGTNSGTVGVVFTSLALTNALSDTVIGTNTVTVSGFGYTGQSFWVTNASGLWTSFDNWDLAGGTPGLDGALSLNDTATFDTRGLASGVGTVTLNTNAQLTALTFSNAAATYVIGGTGTITLQAGSNQPVINNFAGSHTISNTVNILTNLTVNNAASGSSLTLGGRVIAPGSNNILLTHAGSGTLVFAGPTNNTGLGLVASSGMTLLSNSAGFALSEIRALDAGAVVQYRANNQIFSGDATPNYGKVRMTGGTLDLNGFSDTINTITDGTGSNGSVGMGTITSSAAGGMLRIGRVGTNTYRPSAFGGVITGSLAIVMSNNATLTLTGSNSYTGGTLVSAGTMIGDTTSLQGAITNNSAVTFTNTSTGTYAGVMSGNGTLTMNGSGSLILTGNNTLSGTTVITNGTLQVGDGGATGSLGSSSVVNNGALAFNLANALTVSGRISGSGSVAQIGTGTTTLSGLNNYSGTTTVSSGTLLVNGTNSGSGAMNVNAGTLGGTGRIVGPVTLASGANLTPGNGSTAGTLRVGNLTINSGGNLNIFLGGSATSLVSVTGSATLGGTLNFTPLGSLTAPIYTFLTTTAGYTGTFGVATNVPAGYTLVYGSNSVYLQQLNNILGTLTTTFAGTNAVITGGTTNFLVGASNSSTASTNAILSATAGSNTAGSIGSTTITPGASTNLAGLSFTGTNVGPGQTGTFTVNADGNTPPSTNATVSVDVYGHASGSLDTTNLILSNWITGYTGTVSSTNSATLSNAAGFNVDLSASNASGGLISNVAALGAGSTTALTANLNATGIGTGTYSSNVTVTFADASSLSGASANLGTTNILVTGTVYGHASGSISTNKVALSDVIIGYGSAVTTNLVVSNAAGTYNVALQAIGSTNGNFSLAGVGSLTQGSSTNVAVTLGTGQGTGTYSNNLSVVFGDASDLAGAVTNLSTSTVTVTGNVYAHASGSLVDTTISLSNAIVGFNTAIATNLAVTNAAGFRVDLKTISTNANTNLTITDVTALVQNTTANLGFTLSTNQGVGAFTNLVTVVSADDSTLSGATTNATNTVTVTGAIYDHASGSLSTNSIALRAVHVGYTNAQTNLIGMSNAAGFRVAMKTDATNSGNSLSLGAVSNVAAGSSANALLTFATNQGVGSFTNVIGVVFGDDSTLSGNIAQVGTNFLTVTGLVYSGQSYWVTNGSGNWTNFSSWDANGGTPGLDGALSVNDTATFDTRGLLSGTGTATLNTNATLSSLSFSNGAATYVIAGSGTVTMQTLGKIANLAGTNVIGTTVNLATNVTVTNDSGLLAFGGAITGNGGVTVTGSGTTVFTGSNSYSGITVISGGNLQLGDGVLNGSLGTGGLVDNGNLILNQGGTLLISNAISGTGSLTLIGSGTAILTGNNTYAGRTSITNGTLQIGNGGTNGTLGGGPITNDGTLAFNLSGSNTFSNAVSGTGGISQIGSGTLLITGSNSYSGVTLVAAGGTLVIGDGTTNGNIGMGSVTNDGAFVFYRGDNLTFSNVISGSGDVVQFGSGTTTLTGNNTYTGSTIIRGGGQIIITSASAISYSTNINLGLSNAPGTLDLTTFSTNGFTFGTNQTISGVGIVDSGSSTNHVITIEGTLSPGNSIGTINYVVGSLVLTNGSQSVFDLGTAGPDTNPALGLSDRTEVTGNLTLGGSLILRDNNNENGQGSIGGGSYRLFTYGSSGTGTVTGAFTNPMLSVVLNQTLYLPTIITNTASNAIDLNILPVASGSFFEGAAATTNYHITASAGQGTVTTVLTVTNLLVGDDFSALLNSSTIPTNVTITGTNINLAPSALTNVVFTIDQSVAGITTGDAVYAMSINGTNSLGSHTITYTAFGYTGLSYWVTNGSGNWTNFGSWDAAGGTPGLDGALSVNDTATFGTNGSGTVVLNTNATISSLTFSNASAPYQITGSGTVTLQTAGLLNNLAGSNTVATTLNLATNVTLSNNALLSLPGRINGGGSLAFSGTGTTTLSVSNSYTGGTTLNGGTLVASHASALGSGTATLNDGTLSVVAPLTLSSLVWNGGVIALPNLTNAFVTVTGAVTLGTTNTFDLTGLTLGMTPVKLLSYGSGVSTTNFTATGLGSGINYSFSLSNSAVWISLADLAVTNSNTVAPVGSNTYGAINFGSNSGLNIPTNSSLTSGTNVHLSNNSSVNLGGGSLSAGSNVMVDPGSTLGGNGTINASNTTIGGKLAPEGTNPLTINGNLVFQGTGTYLWSLFDNTTNNAPGNTNFTVPLVLNGNLTVTNGASVSVNLTNLTAANNALWLTTGVTNSWVLMTNGAGMGMSSATNFGINFLGNTNGFSLGAFSLAVVGQELMLNYYLPGTVYWNGLNGSNWNTPGSWSNGITPQPSTDVVINNGTNGAAPLLTNSAAAKDLIIGSNTASNSLVLSNGGSLDVAGNTILGAGSNSSNNSLVINGSGSSLTNGGNLIIGSNGASNSMLISGGGSASASNTIIGAGTSASNNSLTVNGGSLSNSGDLYVGSNGPNNSLVIGTNTNSMVTAANTYIGFGSNSTNNLLSVNGGTLSNSGSIQMGGTGGNGTLSLNNGGSVYATNIVVNTNSTLGGNGIVYAQPGGVDVNGGTIAPSGTNSLVINGDLNFNTVGSTYLWSLFNNTTNGPGVNFTVPLQLNGTLSVAPGSIFSMLFTNAVDNADPFWTNNRTWTVMNGGNVSAGTNFAIAFAAGSIQAGFTTSEFSFLLTNNSLNLVYTAPVTTIVTNSGSTNVMVDSGVNNKVVQDGTGTTTLGGSNASSLSIIVNNGSLNATNQTGVLAALVNVTVNGGTFGVQGAGTNNINNFTVNGGTVAAASNVIIAVTNQFSMTGGNLSGGTYLSANYTFSPSATSSVSATLGNLNTNSWALITNNAGGSRGTTIFNSDMTYTGGTMITNATLQLGSGSLTGSVIGTITNNGTLAYGYNGSWTATNTVVGSGIIGQVGTGTLTIGGGLSGTFTGSLAAANGTLQITNTNTIGGATNAMIGGNGVLQLAGTVSDFSTPVSVTNGTGVIRNAGSGTVTLTGSLTKLNRTLVLSGASMVVNGPIIGRNGIFDSDLILSNASSVTLATNQTYFGPTWVQEGSTLILGTNNALPVDTLLTLGTASDSGNNTFDMAGKNQTLAGLASPTGASSVNLVTNSGAAVTLTVNGIQNTTYSGTISGDIALVRAGTGAISLTRNNTYTGGTTINSGKIVTTANTALGTGSVLLAGGTLEVRSLLTIGAITWSGGQIALPTLTSANGIYVVSTNGLTLSGGNTFNLTGASLTQGVATPLLGATNMSTNNFSTNDFAVTGVGAYELLLSNNILWIELLAAPDPTNSVPAYPNFMIPGLTPNQQQVAGALNKWAGSNPTGDQVTVLNALTNIPSSEWAAAFDQISPRFYQQLSTIAFNLANAQNNELIQRMYGLRVSGTGFSMSGFADNISVLEGQGDGVLDAKKDILRPGADTHWGMFVDGNGIFGQANSGNMLPNFNFQSGGVTTGLTYQWNDTFLTGIYAGYQGAYAKNTGLGTLIDNSVRFGVIGTYGTASGKGFYADALLGGGYNNYQISRTIQFGGINRTANSTPGAGELDSMIAAGYNWRKGNWSFGPIGSLQYTYFGVNSFTETGAQSLNLANQGWSASSMISSLGANCAYSWQAKKDVMVVPQINLGWQHEFLQNPYAINSTMSGTPFGNWSSTPIRDTLYTGVGVTLEYKKRWNTAFFYNAAAGNNDLTSQNIFWSLGCKF